MHGTTVLGGDDKLDGFLESCEGYFCPEHLRFPCFEHEDCADLEAPQLCFACSAEAERLYRTDHEWRALWPTDEPPLPASGIETRRAASEAAVHESPTGAAGDAQQEQQ